MLKIKSNTDNIFWNKRFKSKSSLPKSETGTHRDPTGYSYKFGKFYKVKLSNSIHLAECFVFGKFGFPRKGVDPETPVWDLHLSIKSWNWPANQYPSKCEHEALITLPFLLKATAVRMKIKSPRKYLQNHTISPPPVSLYLCCPLSPAHCLL